MNKTIQCLTQTVYKSMSIRDPTTNTMCGCVCDVGSSMNKAIQSLTQTVYKSRSIKDPSTMCVCLCVSVCVAVGDVGSRPCTN